MNILVTLDRNYLPQLEVMLYSVTDVMPGQCFTVYILHSSLTEEDIESVKKTVGKLCDFISIRVESDHFDKYPVTSRYPKEMYYRIFAAQYLPQELDRILYLDPDIVALNPFDELYNLELGDNLIAGASHLSNSPLHMFNEIRLEMDEGGVYVNSGVMLLNLPLLRREQNMEEVMDYIERNKNFLFLPDQDVISGLYGHRILPVDTLIYNLDERTYQNIGHRIKFLMNDEKLDLRWVCHNTSLVHYCGNRKPWKKDYSGDLGIFYTMVEKKVRQHRQQAGKE